jgi:hypothetical protein
VAAPIVVYDPPSQAEWARMATGREIRAALTDIAEKGKRIAETIAPRETGRYSAAFEVRQDTVTHLDRAGHPRAAAVLINTVPYAAVVEVSHHVLARTRDWLGVR